MIDYPARLAEARDVGEVGAVVRTAARRLLGCEGATFVLRDGDRCFYADEDSIAPLWKGQRFPIDECISGWAMRNGEPAVIPDISVDPRVPYEAYRPTYVRSLAMMPIGRVGAVGAYWATEHRATDEELALLRDLADRAAAAIDAVGLDTAPWAPSFRS